MFWKDWWKHPVYFSGSELPVYLLLFSHVFDISCILLGNSQFSLSLDHHGTYSNSDARSLLFWQAHQIKNLMVHILHHISYSHYRLDIGCFDRSLRLVRSKPSKSNCLISFEQLFVLKNYLSERVNQSILIKSICAIRLKSIFIV